MDYRTFDNPISNLWHEQEGEIGRIKDFDDVLELVGSNGKYQKQLLYFVLVPMSILYSILNYSFVFLFAVPAHHCHVPKYNETGWMSLSQRENITIPLEIGADGREEFSECFMFVSPQNHTQIPCSNGWDYDRKDYSATMSSTFNWVCDKATYSTQAITAASVGTLFGPLLSGWIGDRFGRRPAFIWSFFTLLLFKTLQLFLAEYFLVFLLLNFIAGAFVTIILPILSSLIAELTSPDARSWLYGLYYISWSFGNCILPLIAWSTRDWFFLGLCAPIPLILLLLLASKLLPHSPRWFLSKNKFMEASGVLEKIGKTNQRETRFKSGDFVEILKILKSTEPKHKERFWNLFLRRNLARNTIMLAVSYSLNFAVYFGITINSPNLSGNQFLDYFILAVIDLPSAGLAVLLIPRTGRRWPNTFSFVGAWIYLGIGAVSTYNQITWMILPLLFLTKFSLGFTAMIFPLQAFELFPTSLRTTGLGFVFTITSIVNLATPSLVYIGTSNPSILYLVLSIFSFVGMLAASLLPETLHQTLPETIEEANELGKNAKYWSYLPPDYKLE